MSDPPPPPPPTFPKWLAPLIRILLTVGFVGGYIVLFAIGLWLGLWENGHKDFPTSNEDAQATIAALGGIAATLFAVALNLPSADGFFERAARTLGMTTKSDWDGLDRKVLVFFGTALVICYVPFTIIGYVITVARAEADVPSFIANFGGPGMGVLLTAATLSLGRLTRPKG